MRKKIFIFALVLVSISFLLNFFFNKEVMGVDVYVSLGNEMGFKGKHFEAGKSFKKALKIDPYHMPAYLGLGSAYGNSGRAVDAIEVFKEGIKINPSHKLVPKMQMGIASLAYNKMNDGKTAVEYAKKALQHFTDQGDYFGVVKAGQKLKQFDPGS